MVCQANNRAKANIMDTSKRLIRMALMVAIIVLGPVLILGQIMAVAVLECLLLAWQQYHKLLAMCRPHQAAAVGSQPTHPKFRPVRFN